MKFTFNLRLILSLCYQQLCICVLSHKELYLRESSIQLMMMFMRSNFKWMERSNFRKFPQSGRKMRFRIITRLSLSLSLDPTHKLKTRHLLEGDEKWRKNKVFHLDKVIRVHDGRKKNLANVKNVLKIFS